MFKTTCSNPGCKKTHHHTLSSHHFEVMWWQSWIAKFLHPHLPAMSYVFPKPQNIMDIDPLQTYWQMYFHQQLQDEDTPRQRKKNRKHCKHSKAIINMFWLLVHIDRFLIVYLTPWLMSTWQVSKNTPICAQFISRFRSQPHSRNFA